MKAGCTHLNASQHIFLAIYWAPPQSFTDCALTTNESKLMGRICRTVAAPSCYSTNPCPYMSPKAITSSLSSLCNTSVPRFPARPWVVLLRHTRTHTQSSRPYQCHYFFPLPVRDVFIAGFFSLIFWFPEGKLFIDFVSHLSPLYSIPISFSNRQARAWRATLFKKNRIQWSLKNLDTRIQRDTSAMTEKKYSRQPIALFSLSIMALKVPFQFFSLKFKPL